MLRHRAAKETVDHVSVSSNVLTDDITELTINFSCPLFMFFTVGRKPQRVKLNNLAMHIKILCS